ncbi:MAG: glycosyltransferase family 4 protein [Chlorobium sp.]|nr:glycosyltransferase family 4 protein [Chlorobium sp.]
MSKKKSIFIVGPFPPPFSGTTIKNEILSEWLSKENVIVTHINTISKGFRTVFNILKFTLSNNRYLILSVSTKGRNVLIPYAYFAKTIFCKKIILLPCGGTMPDEMMTMGGLRAKFYHLACKSMVRIFVETCAMEMKLKQILGTSNIEVMPNFKPCPQTAPTFKQNRTIRLVYMSRLRREKGVFILVDAVQNLKEVEHLNITLDFFGDFLKCDREVENEFMNKIDNLNYIQFNGYLHPDKVNLVLRAYDIYVFPTYFESEGFPGALIDAAYAGLPVVATNIAYNAEIVQQGVTGLLCHPKDVQSMMDCIRTLYYDPAKRLEFGKNNWNRSAHFNPQIAARRIVDAFSIFDNNQSER